MSKKAGTTVRMGLSDGPLSSQGLKDAFVSNDSLPPLPSRSPSASETPTVYFRCAWVICTYSLLSSMVVTHSLDQRKPSVCHGPCTLSFGFQGQSLEENAMSRSSCRGELHSAPIMQMEWRFPGESSLINVFHLLNGRETSPQKRTSKRGLGNLKLEALQ